MSSTTTAPESPAPVETPFAPEASNAKRDMVFKLIRPEVDKKVEEAIDDETNKAIGGGNFKFFGIEWLDDLIGGLIGIVFQIAKSLGFDKQLAGFFGKHIPDETEKNALKDQISASIADVTTQKSADGKYIAASMTQEEIGKAVHDRVLADLDKNETLAFMTPEQKEQAAVMAGEKAKSSHQQIVAFFAPPKAPATPDATLAKGTPEEQVKHMLASMSQDIISQSVPADLQSSAPTLIPIMSEVGAKVIMENKDLLNNPDELTKRYIAALQENPQALEGFKKLGLDLNDATSRALVKDILQDNIANWAPNLKLAVAGEGASAAPPAPKQINYNAIIAEKISDAIIEKTAGEVLAQYNDRYLIGPTNLYVKDKSVTAAAATLNKYKENPAVTDEQKAEVKNAQLALYDRAVELNSAPNNAQRERIAQLTADITEATLRNVDNKGLSQDELAATLKTNIDTHLREQQVSIDALGISIKRINYNPNPFGKNGDLLGKIAGSIGDMVADKEDKTLYSLLSGMQEKLLERDAQVAFDGADKKGLVTGLKGENAEDIQAQAGAKKGATRGA